jgi:chitinase
MGDSCSSIAETYSLTEDDLANFNNNTWGWMGCSDLQAGYLICLSTGTPPMPASIPNAVCGPQKPGTSPPAAGVDIASLNPCPLNACCDIYGQCGTTPDFCTTSQSPTGAPGTAAIGSNGCISNCGTEIVVGSAPSEYMSVGFFEGYNTARPCLNQPITSMDLSSYTHIHLSFAAVTTDYALDVSAIQSQFDSFVDMSGIKRVLSVGGWSFSTDPSTYSILRNAVTPANQATFVANIVSFIEEYDLDGIDIDWECKTTPIFAISGLY